MRTSRYRRVLNSRRASLEISIQAIVIVVLAMTLLGLGLTFIKKMFGNVDVLSTGTFEKIQEQLQRDLVNSNEKLVFSQTKVTMERGGEKLFGWGVKNVGSSKLNYWAEFTPVKCPTGECSNDVRFKDELNTKWFSFKYNPQGQNTNLLYELDAASNQFVRVNLNIPKDADPGLYLIDMSIYDDFSDERYASTDLFVTVT
ncbi:TPA: hypothetical protein HA372_03250 [Candidatus Woesearchaeota archaeon]|nr:hypothetical protein [Candidatus Woesearchaeota archaeon]HII65315.1 hypothetical protein [Candidatus Woesearchaeota archaeon]HIJ18675.1 hypothetical protein [Candidatus Woesearchaeota archaeon]